MGHSRLKADSLTTSVVLLLIVTVVQRGVGLGRSVVFCRWLSPETLGQWEMVFSFLLLAAPLAVLGVPGSYGRYLEHYRQRGHLRTFLRRTMTWTVLCTATAVALIWAFAPQFSDLLFSDPSHTTLLGVVSVCLATVILQHTLLALFNALRLFRIVSAMNFVQSILFASLSMALLFSKATVIDIVIGYGAGCLVASIGALIWAWPALKTIDRPQERLSQSAFWPRLMQFAFFVWVTNLLTHLFAIVDRYMIIHFSGMASAEALEQVGYYHSSRIIPLLVLSFADVLSGLIMPHLSHDWEARKHDEVSQKLKLAIKLVSLGMLLFGICVIAFAPILFEFVLQGKYTDGLSVLPWTLVGCVWFGVYLLAQNYLWCAEKTRLATVPLILGLIVNVLLNLILLPMWGLLGAVIATAVSTSVCLVIVLMLNSHFGMKLDLGLWIAVTSPVFLTIDMTICVAVALVLFAAASCTTLILDERERKQLATLISQALQRIRVLLPSGVSQTGGV